MKTKRIDLPAMELDENTAYDEVIRDIHQIVNVGIEDLSVLALVSLKIKQLKRLLGDEGLEDY